MTSPTLQFKRGNAGVAGTVPALRPGEPALSLNNFDFFIGIDTSVANNKFFGSHRYWGREDGTNSLRFKLVDKNGTNSVNLKAPDTLAGVTTYTFPATPTDGYFLRTNANGILSWDTFSSNLDGSSINNLTLTGITTVSGTLNATGNIILGDASGDTITVNGTTTFTQPVVGTISTATRANTLDVVGVATNQNYNIALFDGSGNSKSAGVDSELLYNPNTNVLSVPQITIGAGVGVTQFVGTVSAASSTTSVPTSSAVINYVGTQIGNIDLTLGLTADSGGPSTVNTSQTLTISGTASEVETSVSGQTVTVGLPNDVVVGTSLSTPTVKTGTIQAQDSTVAITISSGTGNVGVSSDLTVGGNLYVNGTTTQVNTNTLTVEDRTLELGRVIAGQPTSTTWDLAVLFNYGDGAAKKAGVVWEASGATKRFQFTTDVTTGADGGPSDTNLPAFTVSNSNFAPIEVSELWINNTCSGGAQQVIGCVGSELQLQNIIVDAGGF